MAKLFGTDGVRGVANRDLTPELAFALGRAAVSALGDGRPTIVIGRDTRASGEMLEAAFAAGVCSAGGDVVRAGVIPTPGVAFLTAELGATAGVVVSASHNPPEDNGIKFFGAGGRKLPDAAEAEIERRVLQGGDGGERPQGGAVGRIRDQRDGVAGRYLAHLADAAEGTLDGMRVVVDCAHGAASELAPELLGKLGAEVHAIGNAPDGTNINVGCGATHPEVVAEAVVELGADAGVAHDGDADRAILVDAEGRIVDGDHILAAAAVALHEAGRLTKDTVVSTVMANLGFRRAMEEARITVLETSVGDRYVLEEMHRSGAVLGGEQSGHIVFLEKATTGDGLLTATWFLALARRTGRTVAELASVVRKYPQVLVAVPVGDREALERASTVWEAVRKAEDALGAGGRVLVRASGTEPVVRVMVEAETEEAARGHADAISEVVRTSLS
jgi:phosphoglucosamine mutase